MPPSPSAAAAVAEELVPTAAAGSRIPIQASAADWLRRALAVLDRGRVVVVDFASTTPALAARPWREWVRTYRGHGPGGSPLEAPGSQDITCEVPFDQLADTLRDLTGDGPGPALLLLEEDDEHLAVVRVDGGAGSLEEPRVFLSDRRAVLASDVAQMLWEDTDPPVDDEDEEDEGTRPIAEPVGDTGVFADLGTPPDDLLELCAEEGLLPADVLTTVCERAGCVEIL
ncbi:MAG: tRNA adenosine deaminase-associated protein, partial [Actinobacteria bacterium]|nr:tRNA adenosine deaminase-associated protein [Actinomycetota bacterium]